ncbi:hypothetical protein KUCAC02_037275, partial [Chaenocephalus aceratus]
TSTRKTSNQVFFITINLFTHQKSLGESTQPKKDIGPRLIPIKAATSTRQNIKPATSTRKTSNQ